MRLLGELPGPQDKRSERWASLFARAEVICSSVDNRHALLLGGIICFAISSLKVNIYPDRAVDIPIHRKEHIEPRCRALKNRTVPGGRPDTFPHYGQNPRGKPLAPFPNLGPFFLTPGEVASGIST